MDKFSTKYLVYMLYGYILICIYVICFWISSRSNISSQSDRLAGIHMVAVPHEV